MACGNGNNANVKKGKSSSQNYSRTVEGGRFRLAHRIMTSVEEYDGASSDNILEKKIEGGITQLEKGRISHRFVCITSPPAIGHEQANIAHIAIWCEYVEDERRLHRKSQCPGLQVQTEFGRGTHSLCCMLQSMRRTGPACGVSIKHVHKMRSSTRTPHRVTPCKAAYDHCPKTDVAGEQNQRCANLTCSRPM